MMAAGGSGAGNEAVLADAGTAMAGVEPMVKSYQFGTIAT